MTVLASARLRYEPMSDAHFDGLAAMNGDPEVMRYISGRAETPDETGAMIARVRTRWDEWGYAWWTLLDAATGEVVGAGGIQHLGRDRANPHEIGWRLRRASWGLGLATEAAHTMAGHAFAVLEAPLLCAVRHPDNAASQRVMDRLGMRYTGMEDWDDARVPVHALTRAEWVAMRASDPRD